jgi:transcriptional regulator with XRE-family HTH domain
MTVGFDRRALAPRRRRLGLSQTDLASLLGVTQQAVSDWERGITTPVTDSLPGLAAALDCRIDDLFIAVDGAAI